MLVTAVVSNPRTMNTLSAVTYYDIACEWINYLHGAESFLRN
jgi:hypothetical protein